MCHANDVVPCGTNEKIQADWLGFFGWGAGIQNLYANPRADLVSSFELIKHHDDKTKERNKSSLLFFGWGAGIRTPVMTESESVALPLGDAPISSTPIIIPQLLRFVNSFFEKS